MKRLFLALSFLITFGLCAFSQAWVDINVHQNPLFEVSTNSVNAALPEGAELKVGGDIVVKGGSGTYSYRWYAQGGGDLGTEPTLIITEPGKYFLDISDTCDCLQTVEFNVTLTSVSDVVADTVSITPNPTDGYIEFPGFEAVQLTATSLTGRLAALLNGAAFSSADLSHLAPGAYIIILTDKEGKTLSAKIIKN